MKFTPGDTAPAIAASTIRGKPAHVPDPLPRYVHLQFRRFAGCPVCNFHLLTMGRRHAETAAAGIRQLVFFHSSREEMLKYQAQLPFDCIADPGKKYFKAFGVETSVRALLNPRVFWSGLRWILAARRFYTRAENGILGLPADFLIDAQGRIVACKYGAHADDHWEVDELLQLAGEARSARPVPPTTPALMG
ncbi:redoxin domain-containing protein [Variovorax sp. OV700]|uniref:redoxin domain-containing protein n=1 Tax=Variovorax sp. OV700 TaxID=1882826 RepID=UPI000883976F|nr:redoxin domain-containing protein [Variovorax sp. OV700]SDH94229.1 Peroxiredoxin [Variovorax sp. OV700]